MHVFYDLRFASDRYPGIGTHAYHLLRALQVAMPHDRWTVLRDPGLEDTRFDTRSARTHERVAWIEQPMQVNSPLSLLRLGRLVRSSGAEVFLSPFYLRPVGGGRPTVLTLHDVLPLTRPDLFGVRARLAFRIAMEGVKRADRVITSSNFARAEILRHLGLDPARVHVIPPGVPAQQSPLSRPAGLPDGPFALVVGINKPHKNLELLARTWRLLDDSAWMLVGAGPVDARYPSLAAAAEKHDAKNVWMLGRVAEAELGWLYANARVLVFPSEHEGFGFPMLEAAARGVPALAADIPALRELGGRGAEYLPADPAVWADAVTRFMKDDRYASQLRASAHERASELGYDRCAAAVSAVMEATAT